MTEHVPPDRARLTVDADGASIHLEGVSVAEPHGWTVLNRATLVVVDGPGDEGFLLRRVDEQGRDLAPTGWDEAVAAGPVTVVLTDDGTRLEAAGA